MTEVTYVTDAVITYLQSAEFLTIPALFVFYKLGVKILQVHLEQK